MTKLNFQKIILEADTDTLNPLLEPERTAHLTIRGITVAGEEVSIPPELVKFNVTTLLTCGDAEVLSVEKDGTVQPLNGGYARIEASYIGVGHGLTDYVKIVVRPFWQEYHKSLTFKLFLAMEPYGSLLQKTPTERDESVFLDLDETLDLIHRLDIITDGMPKILYLVGWQRGGHDHGYPDISTPNPRLKRPEDATAADSIRWLMREGQKYHTAVSLHINLLDAWSDSPLWETYAAEHLFVEDDAGHILTAGGGGFEEIEERYHVRTANVVQSQLWKSGHFARRIEELLRVFPELVESHTIHIDNWRTAPCARMGITRRDEEDAIREMYRYLRSVGLDATSEGSFHGRDEPMTGLQPMTWIDVPYHQSVIPPSLYCGGRMKRVDGDPRFGDSIHIENSVRVSMRRGDDPLTGIQDEFCQYTLPWQFLNHFTLKSYDGQTAVYSDGVKAYMEDGIPYIWWNDTRIRCGSALFVPMLWRKERAIMLYSYRDTYICLKLPKGWEDVQAVDFWYVDPLGRYETKIDDSAWLWEGHNAACENGEVKLNLDTRTTYIIRPHGEK